MSQTKEHQPTAVPGDLRVAPAKQAGDVRGRWAWTEPTVWTDRMLTALETGVKGGKWFSLMDKVWSEKNLFWSAVHVAQNEGAAGVDHVTIDAFKGHWDANLDALARTLQDGTYRPQAVRRCWIDKLGSTEKRPLGIPTVRDRVVQTALRHVLEPIFERDFAEHSYGFRPGRGCKDALRRVEHLLQAGYGYIVDADLKSYFDSIPHDQLMTRLQTKVADGRVLALVEAFLQQGVMEGLAEWTPETGSPQGAVISPLLSNIYLDPLDHLLAEHGFEMVRYADDFVVLCRTAAAADAALALVQHWVAQAGLVLHPTKTRIVTAATGFDFLGYHFERGYRWPRPKSLAKLKAALRPKTKRTNGRSLRSLITEVNRTLRGWFEYFKHSHWTTFRRLDQWVRMRLRSLLRKRCRRRGRGRGKDHQRWPNAFFTAQGLFSLVQAHALVSQPSLR